MMKDDTGACSKAGELDSKSGCGEFDSMPSVP